MAELTEEMILNDSYGGCVKHYRRFRIEYGFECSCHEGVIYLPPEVDPDVVEAFLDTIIPGFKGCKLWREVREDG